MLYAIAIEHLNVIYELNTTAKEHNKIIIIMLEKN